ncbi:MAG: thioesterase family protein [Actinomycetota bacterium]
MIHRFPIRVRFYELDPYYHVNHSVYVQYFEAARIEMLREVGLTLRGMEEEGVMLVVSEIATKFIRPAQADDELVAETELVEFKRVSSRWHQRLLRGDEVLVEQTVHAASTNLEGRPVRLPAAMADPLRAFLKE